MKLILFPNVLDPSQSHEEFFASGVQEAVLEIDGLIAESEKRGRAFLKRFTFKEPKTFRDVPIRVLSEHTKDHEVVDLLVPILNGEKWGLVSDCGLPCIADPGAELVLKAHQHKVKLETFPGPSSIIYALMLSGLSANSFSFHGYLPRKPHELQERLHYLAKHASASGQTQVFIEAPYRTGKLLQDLINCLPPKTLLSLAWNLTLPNQGVMTQTIYEWKKGSMPNLEKSPAVFLFSVPKIHKKKAPAKKAGRGKGFYGRRR